LLPHRPPTTQARNVLSLGVCNAAPARASDFLTARKKLPASAESIRLRCPDGFNYDSLPEHLKNTSPPAFFAAAAAAGDACAGAANAEALSDIKYG
jgi:hypothetical protein